MRDLLYSIPPWVFIAFVAHLAILGTVAYLILLERKVASWVQDRLGPNRVGPWGLLQPIADGLKFIFKEDYKPAGVDKYLFTLAPAIMMGVVIVSIAIIPWGGVHQVTRSVDVTDVVGPIDEEPALATAAATTGTPEYIRARQSALDVIPINAELYSDPTPARRDNGRLLVDVTYRYAFQIARLNVGILLIVAVLSLAVYGVVLGGWASNNKYSFLGGLRATAQMISYEIPMGLSILTIIIMSGSLELGEIVNRQAHYWGAFVGDREIGLPAWNVFCQPVAFLMFLICIHAEANRAPFDLAEAEQELVGGYHTEYSAMRFALFFLAEYAGMITTSAICVALFFGGWHFPGLSGPDLDNPEVTTSLLVCLLRSGIFFAKTLLIVFIFMWVRWSLPRFRFDQLMMLAWRSLIPLSLALLLATAVVIFFFGAGNGDFQRHRRIDFTLGLALLAANVAAILLMAFISRIIPAAPATNRRTPTPGSRFHNTPLPAGT